MGKTNIHEERGAVEGGINKESTNNEGTGEFWYLLVIIFLTVIAPCITYDPSMKGPFCLFLSTNL